MTARVEKACVAVLLGISFPVLFALTSQRALAKVTGPPGWLVTPLDGAIPAVPAAVWVYMSWYPATAAVLWLDQVAFRRACAAYVASFLLCIAGYIVLPITISRPVVDPAVGPSSGMLDLLYSIDPPVNLFPSFHAAVATVLVLASPRAPAVRGAVVTWALALYLSCVLTKQHYVLDLVAGVAVGLLATGLALRGIRPGSGSTAAHQLPAS